MGVVHSRSRAVLHCCRSALSHIRCLSDRAADTGRRLLVRSENTALLNYCHNPVSYNLF